MTKQLLVKKIKDEKIKEGLKDRLVLGTINQIVNMFDIMVSNDEIVFPLEGIDNNTIETLILRYPRMFTFIKESEYLKQDTKDTLIERIEEIMEFLIKELRKEDVEYSNEKFLESIKWF